MSHDGMGFDSLDGEMLYDSDNDPYFNYTFSVTDKGSVFLKGESSSEQLSEDEWYVYDVIVRVYEDNVQVKYPYISNRAWTESTFMNILDYFNRNYDSFGDKNNFPEDLNYNDYWTYRSPNPIVSSLDILELFDKSLFRFRYIEDHNKIEGIEFDDDVNYVHSLLGPENKEIGVYYVSDKDYFMFREKYSDNPVDLFDGCIFELLTLHYSVDELDNPYPDVIDENIFLPWLHKYGDIAITFFNIISDYLVVTEDTGHITDIELYDKMKEKHSDEITTLLLLRLEADLISLLDYEYRLNDEMGTPPWLKEIQSKEDSPIREISWNNSHNLYNKLYNTIGEEISHDAFDYDKSIGIKGEILYHKDNENVKVALQLNEYGPMFENLERNNPDIHKKTPMCWFATPIGIKKLNDEIPDSDLESYLDGDSLYYMTESELKKSTQLLNSEIYDKLDIILNEPEDDIWS